MVLGVKHSLSNSLMHVRVELGYAQWYRGCHGSVSPFRPPVSGLPIKLGNAKGV
jgi:hypothetical protein